MVKSVSVENYKLLTHKACMDGSASAIAFISAGGRIENVVFTNPNHEESDEKLRKIIDDGYVDILIADCSISYEFAKEIDSVYKNLNITLLDHHKTAIPLAEFDWCYIDKENTASGAKMLFEYLQHEYKHLYKDETQFTNNYYKSFFNLVDDHDRWCKNYPESEDLAILHSVQGQKMFIDIFRHPRSSDCEHFTLKQEKFLINLEKEKIAEMIEDKKRAVKNSIVTKNIKGKDYRFGFIGGAAKYTSQIAEAMYSDPILNLDAVVLVSVESISMRCRKDVDLDLSEIAKINNGGGHKSASGFLLASLLGKSLIEFVSDNIKLG